MDFELSDDQVALVEAIDAVLAGHCSMAAVRAAADTHGVDRRAWKALADTGVFALALPEADGGVGLGYADAVLVFEALGRVATPGPLVATFLAAGLVDGASSGDAVVGIVEREPSPIFVEHLGALDALLVLDDQGVAIVDPSALAATELERPLDFLTPTWVVDALPAGERVGDAALAQRMRLVGGVLTSALQLGLAHGATALATAYAKERHQFGKPIGQFQSIKHICADMLTRAEVCRAAVHYAGVCLDDAEIDDVERAASSARVLAIAASEANGKSCIQVHGGMGYTWEVDAHVYMKRAWALTQQFGDGPHHAERVAAAV